MFVVVEVDILLKVYRAAVEVGKEVWLVVAGLLYTGQSVNKCLWMDLLLNVYGNDGNGKIFAVLFILAIPD